MSRARGQIGRFVGEVASGDERERIQDESESEKLKREHTEGREHNRILHSDTTERFLYKYFTSCEEIKAKFDKERQRRGRM